MPFNQVAEDTLRESLSCIERLKNFRIPYDPQRDELYRHFVGRAKETLYPDGKTKRSSVFVPYAYANVEQIRSELHDIFWSINPPFQVLPVGQNDEKAAINMQPVMELKCLRQGKLRSAFDEFVGGLCIYGFGALKVDWNYDYQRVMGWEVRPVLNPDGSPQPHPMMPDQPMLARQQVIKKVPYACPIYTPIDIYDLLVDPDGAYVGTMFTKTLPQLLREMEINPNLYDGSAIQRLQTEFGTDASAYNAIFQIAELYDAVNGTFTLQIIPEDVNAIAYKDRRYSNRSATYSSYRRPVGKAPAMLLSKGAEPIPFFHSRVPILYNSYTKLPGEIFGLGVVEPTYSINEGLNRFVNMISDKWDLSINGRILVNMNGTDDIDFDAMQKNNVPGGIIPVYGAGDVTKTVAPFPMPKPDAGDYNILPLYKNMAEIASGVSDFYSRGVGESNGNDTATGISQVLGQSNKRLARLALRLEDEILEPLLGMSASMIQQFITDPMELRITEAMQPSIPKVNSNFITVAPEDIAGSFNFHFIGSSYMDNPFTTLRNAMALANIVANNPGLAQFAKPYEGLLELYRIARIPNPHRFVKTEQEVQADMQAAIQQMQQMQAAGLPPNAFPHVPGQGGAAPGAPGGRAKTQFEGPNPVTGATRTFAQNNGANAMGTPGPTNDSSVDHLYS